MSTSVFLGTQFILLKKIYFWLKSIYRKTKLKKKFFGKSLSVKNVFLERTKYVGIFFGGIFFFSGIFLVGKKVSWETRYFWEKL